VQFLTLSRIVLGALNGKIRQEGGHTITQACTAVPKRLGTVICFPHERP
jgi:hypothetical protein